MGHRGRRWPTRNSLYKSLLRSTGKGNILTLNDGTKLQFPIQHHNNLPMMLTHKALHPSKVIIGKPHQASPGLFNNLVNFICLQTFEYKNSQASLVFNNTLPVPRKAEDIQPVMARSN